MLKLNVKNVPNYLTIVRLIFVPIIFAFILLDHYTLAFICFLAANFTDILDGRIARKYNLITDWGKLMDPLADKITQISTITALIIKNIIPFWILLIITVKELIMIIIGFSLYRNDIVTVHSKWYGKVATILLFLAIIFSLLSKTFEKLTNITMYTYYVAVAMTVFAGLMYAKTLIFSDLNAKSKIV